MPASGLSPGRTKTRMGGFWWWARVSGWRVGRGVSQAWTCRGQHVCFGAGRDAIAAATVVCLGQLRPGQKRQAEMRTSLAHADVAALRSD